MSAAAVADRRRLWHPRPRARPHRCNAPLACTCRLGAPDTGLISYAEMVDVVRCLASMRRARRIDQRAQSTGGSCDHQVARPLKSAALFALPACCVQGRNIHEATRSIPIIGDGDTGYGNAMNVKRTVRGYAQAGFAGPQRPNVAHAAAVSGQHVGPQTPRVGACTTMPPPSVHHPQAHAGDSGWLRGSPCAAFHLTARMGVWVAEGSRLAVYVACEAPHPCRA